MLKIEKRFIEWVEKHMLVFQFLLVSLLALYIRRIPIWWNVDEIVVWFDRHENSTQSALYYLILGWMEYLPMLPIHSMKWLSIAGDFGVAFLCLLLVRKWKKENTLLQVFCYTVCLFSPVLLLRGAAWAQIDSFAVMLFLLGWLLWEEKKQLAAGILLLLSALFYPPMLLFGLVFLWTEQKEREWKIRAFTLLGFFALWLVFHGLTGLLIGTGFAEGLQKGFAWLIYDPVTGTGFATGLDWLTDFLIAVGLPVSVLGGLVLVKTQKRKASCFAVLAAHFVLTILYGSRMF